MEPFSSHCQSVAIISDAVFHEAFFISNDVISYRVTSFIPCRQVEKDLMGMRFMAGLVGKVFPEYQYTWLFPDFEETIGLELGKKNGQRNGGGEGGVLRCCLP